VKIISKILIAIAAAIVISGCSNLQSRSSNGLVGYTEIGKASFYGMKHQNKKTASGELFNQNLRTAAHRNLPFDTRVKVTNVENGKSVVVRINDRGPYVKGRIVDLSKSAFSSIANPASGVIRVKLEVVD
jgi:rare lipoprotein A